MYTIRRANVVLDVTENEVEKYLADGFDIIDDNGKVLKASVPNDVNALKKAYVEHENEIKSLKEEIERLKAQTKAVNEKPTKNTKSKK